MTLVGPDSPGAVAVIVTSLELGAHDELIPGREPSVNAEVVEVVTFEGDVHRKAALSESYYRSIGADWWWVDRLEWSTDRWIEWVDRPGHHLLELLVDGEPAGYAELDEQGDGSVELAYFGLLPAFHGLGLGGWLLGRALQRGRELPGVTRVWVHTCTLDGPAALANYRARGMRDFATETEWRVVSEAPHGAQHDDDPS